MILCSCNNIRTEDVQEAKDNGCSTLKECCKYLHLKVECGACLKLIEQEMDNND